MTFCLVLLDVQELVSNPRVWAPILIPNNVASILSSIYVIFHIVFFVLMLLLLCLSTTELKNSVED